MGPVGGRGRAGTLLSNTAQRREELNIFFSPLFGTLLDLVGTFGWPKTTRHLQFLHDKTKLF